MEIGVSLPHVGPLASPTFVVEFAQAAEAAGFRGLWTADHLAIPTTMSSTYTLPTTPVVVEPSALHRTMGTNLEMVSTLAVVAAVTTTIRLGTGVAVLPLRNPLLNARQIATVDLYSGGRVMYGVGVGWLAEEAAALAMPWDARGARTEEHIALLRTLWNSNDSTVSFEGKYISVPEIHANPRPTKPIPILIGGHSATAIDRAARIGDGWIASGMGSERLRLSLGELEEQCHRHGRSRTDLWVACLARMPMLASEPDAVLSRLADHAALGVDHVAVNIDMTTEAAALRDLDRWAGSVLPSLS